MSTPKTPNINLNLPVPGPTGTPSPTWAEELNENFEIIDEAINALGVATSRASTFDVDADIDMDNHKLTALMGMVLQSLTDALANPTSIYVKNGDLYYRDASLNEIRLTASGQIDAKGIFGQYQSSDAFANYVAADGTYEFWDNAIKTSASSIRAGDIILAKKGSNGAIAVRLRMNNGTAAGFTLTLPAALPGVNSVVFVDQTGAMSFSNTLTGVTITASEIISSAIKGTVNIGGNSGDVITIGGALGSVDIKAYIHDSYIGNSTIGSSELSNTKLDGITNLGTDTGDSTYIGKADGTAGLVIYRPQVEVATITGSNVSTSTVEDSTVKDSVVEDSTINTSDITTSEITASEMNNSTIEGVPTADIAALVGSGSNPNTQIYNVYNFDQMDRIAPTQATDNSGNVQRTFWNGLSYQLPKTAYYNFPGRLSTVMEAGSTFGKMGLYSNVPLTWINAGVDMIQTLTTKFRGILLSATGQMTLGFFAGQGLGDTAGASGIQIPLVRLLGNFVSGSPGPQQIQVWNPQAGVWVNAGLWGSGVVTTIKILIKNGNALGYSITLDGVETTYGDYSFDGSNGRQYAGSAYLEIDTGTGAPVGQSNAVISYMEHKTTNTNGR